MFSHKPRLPFTVAQISQRMLNLQQQRVAEGLSETEGENREQTIAEIPNLEEAYGISVKQISSIKLDWSKQLGISVPKDFDFRFAEAIESLQAERVKAKAHELWEARQIKLRESDKRTAADDWRDAEARLQESRWMQIIRWTGIREKKGWDFVQLLASISIPIVIFAGGSLFTTWNNQQQRKIAENRQNDEVLKNYFDSMKALLLDKEHALKKEGETESPLIARTLTLTALRQLGSSGREHKGLLLQFLYESGLIIKEVNNDFSIVNLSGADLSVAYLSSANFSNSSLYGANLSGANLSGATFSGANLYGANFSGANFSGANLYGANLYGTNFQDAHLNGNLENANLSGANFSGADLSGAYLSGADLSGAIFLATSLQLAELTQQQLGGEDPPLLCNATLPEGFPDNLKYRDCDRLPEVLFEYSRIHDLFKTEEEAKQYVLFRKGQK